MEEIIKGNYKGDFINFKGIIHFRYFECERKDLIETQTGELIHKNAYNAFIEMQKNAKKEGINLFIESGFRSVEEQKEIFPKKFKPTEEEFYSRLKFSAPPNFSEHHTGYAIDINSVEDDFKDTKEYLWLFNNSEKFGFYNSFPKNNKQNLGFEPWHYRFIDDETKKIFKKAIEL